MNPNSWLLHGNLGDALLEQGQLDEAIAELRETIRLNPEADDHYNLARALVQTGEAEEAIEHFKKAAALPTHHYLIESYHKLAELYFRLGRRDDALAMAEKVLSIAEQGGITDLARDTQNWITQVRQLPPAR
jgi:tetratricopeptide (TPR) repeat protein